MDRQKNGQTLEWTDGGKDRPYLMRPFWPSPKVQHKKSQKKS